MFVLVEKEWGERLLDWLELGVGLLVCVGDRVVMGWGRGIKKRGVVVGFGF